uniref:Uncharacterized protein n=1 Tax=Romanomermis culicivorax TaxID=13658 RepID=A0A915JU56_ROMCU
AIKVAPKNCQYLSNKEEHLLVELIYSLTFVGMPLSKDYLLAIVDDYIRENQAKFLRKLETININKVI